MKSTRPVRFLATVLTVAALMLATAPAAAQEARSQITGVTISSTPKFDTNADGRPDTYGVDETIEVWVTWDKDVTWDVSADERAQIRLRVGAGSDTRPTRLVTGSATSGTGRTLMFRYTVVRTDRYDGGVGVIAASSGDLVFLARGATLKDADDRPPGGTTAACP